MKISPCPKCNEPVTEDAIQADHVDHYVLACDNCYDEDVDYSVDGIPLMMPTSCVVSGTTKEACIDAWNEYVWDETGVEAGK